MTAIPPIDTRPAPTRPGDTPHDDAPGAAQVAAHDAVSSPLSAGQQCELANAQRRRRSIDRAMAFASFNGWCTSVFTALTLLFAFFSVTALVMGIALAGVAFHEFKGRRMLRRLDVRAPRLLGFNQVAFAVILVTYCAWSMAAAITSPGALAGQAAANRELAKMIGPVEDLQRVLAVVFYGIIMVLSIAFQSATAIYYFTRAHAVRAYLDQTPVWVTDLQKALDRAA